MSMSDGSTGTMMASAVLVISGMSCAGTAAGVSTITWAASGGVRISHARVMRVLRSKAAMPWMKGCSGLRFLSQRVLEPWGSLSVSSGWSPWLAK